MGTDYVRRVHLAYLDESHDQSEYWIAGLIVPAMKAQSLEFALDDVVARAERACPALTRGDGKPIELHGHALAQGREDWTAMRLMLRARLGIYEQALRAVAAVEGVTMVRTGVDRRRRPGSSSRQPQSVSEDEHWRVDAAASDDHRPHDPFRRFASQPTGPGSRLGLLHLISRQMRCSLPEVGSADRSREAAVGDSRAVSVAVIPVAPLARRSSGRRCTTAPHVAGPKADRNLLQVSWLRIYTPGQTDRVNRRAESGRLPARESRDSAL